MWFVFFEFVVLIDFVVFDVVGVGEFCEVCKVKVYVGSFVWVMCCFEVVLCVVLVNLVFC